MPKSIPINRRPVIYVAGSLAGEPMTPGQIASALHSARGTPAVRAAAHVIEAYAAEAATLAMNENAIRDGMAGNYLTASGFLNNVLADLTDYLSGRVPDQPVKPRSAAPRPQKPES